jgi:hypothetical protein
MLLTAILLAESATKLKACPVHHLSVVHAMYGEQDRVKTSEDSADGQDFVRSKVKQLTWLYSTYAAAGSSWNYIAVDDGCPNKSGELMQAVIDAEKYSNVEVVYLQTGIEAKEPPFDKLSSPKDSRKGGAILYGLHHASKMTAGMDGKKHLVAYFDADLSADLGLCGLLAQPILAEGKQVSVGQRYGCAGSFLALPEGADGHPHSLWKNTDCFRMILRHFARGILMPTLRGIYDTQCAFKAISADKLGELVRGIAAFGPGFDMELLIVAGNMFGGDGFASVPFLFIEDKEGSTMSSTEEAANKNFFSMLKGMIETHDRFFSAAELSDADKAWVAFFRDLEFEGYQKMVSAIAEKLGAQPAELANEFDLEEIKAAIAS